MQKRAPQEVTLQNIHTSTAFIGDLNRLEAHKKIKREETVALNFAMVPSYVGGRPDSLTDSGLLCKTLMLSAQYDLPVLCYKTLQLMQKIEKQDPSQTHKHFMTALDALTTAQHPQELPHIKTTGHNIISPDITTTQLIIDQLLVYLKEDKKDYDLICETLILSALYNLPVLCYKTLEVMQKIEEREPSQTSKHFMTALHALSTAQHPEELPHIETASNNIISPDITTTQLIIDQLLVYLKENKNLDDLNFFVQHVIKFINSESPLEEKSDVFYATLYALNLIQKHIEKLDNIENIKKTISTLIDTMSTIQPPLIETQKTPTETPISLFNLPGNTHLVSSDEDSVSNDKSSVFSELTDSNYDYSDDEDSDDDKITDCP